MFVTSKETNFKFTLLCLILSIIWIKLLIDYLGLQFKLLLINELNSINTLVCAIFISKHSTNWYVGFIFS